jgi:hypothetical protein
MTVTITREGGVWRYSIDGVEWKIDSFSLVVATSEPLPPAH